MSESWSEIGYEKPKDPVPDLAAKAAAKPLPTHESEKKTVARRARCLEAIFRLFPDAEYNATGMVTVSMENRKIDFYPASDCYFLHAKNEYGTGIELLCAKISTYLNKMEKVDLPSKMD